MAVLRFGDYLPDGRRRPEGWPHEMRLNSEEVLSTPSGEQDGEEARERQKRNLEFWTTYLGYFKIFKN